MYYEAKERALKNGEEFHLAAYTKCGKIGTNSLHRKTAKFKKRYSNSRQTFHEIHAEVDLVIHSKVVPKKINVVRFLHDGTPTMAKPCIHCQNFLRIRGVSTVRYTNWEGEWETMYL